MNLFAGVIGATLAVALGIIITAIKLAGVVMGAVLVLRGMGHYPGLLSSVESIDLALGTAASWVITKPIIVTNKAQDH